MDFTLRKYRQLLEALKGSGYSFLPLGQYTPSSDARIVYLRHDVDLRPDRSLATARLEHELGVRAIYYFRAVPQSWDEGIIREIASLGHEIGYHYESLTTTGGDMDATWEDFRSNLAKLRELSPVDSVCMHGSPRSPYDSKDIWKHHQLSELDIKSEPYLTTDWSQVFYLTDTGRRWDGYKVSVRDKIPKWQDVWNEQGLVFHTTDDIISAAGLSRSRGEGTEKVHDRMKRCMGVGLPPHLMITTHPQRWCNSLPAWLKELMIQNLKNIIKRVLAAK